MTRWSVGIYIGVERRTGQYIVYDHNSETIQHARTIAQVPAPMRWSVEKVKEMSATQWKSREPTGPEVIQDQPADQAETMAKTPTIRRLYIR